MTRIGPHTPMRNQSLALAHKIAKARAAAPADLPLVRHCAHVVLAWAMESEDQERAIADLKAAHGSNWSLVTALQLLSGRRGLFAAECCDGHERVALYHAHLLAKVSCDLAALGTDRPPTSLEVEALRRLATEQADRA
jgi:hypothetical protein